MNQKNDGWKAAELDKKDPLRKFRERFFHQDENLIYLDGNSLGRMPLSATVRVDNILKHQWGDRLIRSWNEHWMDLPSVVSTKIARLLGAAADEVMVGDSTSLNLYKLAFAALTYQKGRKRIVTDSLNFPTDLYILQGLIDRQFSGFQLDIVESEDGISIPIERIAEALTADTALLTLSHVAYKSAYLYDMKAVTRLAHQKGIPVLWDLSHSAGAVPISLNQTGADLAVGCTYKYLNGGPGSPAYLYVRKDLQKKLAGPAWGWFGHEQPFRFEPEYRPSGTVARFQVGTPHVLSMAPIEDGVDILLEAGMENLRKKSIRQTDYLLDLVRTHLFPLGFSLGSPESAENRGSHISIRHDEGYRINQAMIHPSGGQPVVIPDFRPPHNIRLGIAPLYISFTDIHRSILRIMEIVENREYEDFDTAVTGVT